MNALEKNEKIGYFPVKGHWWGFTREDDTPIYHCIVGLTSMKFRTFCGKWIRKERTYYVAVSVNSDGNCPECVALKQAFDVAEKMAKK